MKLPNYANIYGCITIDSHFVNVVSGTNYHQPTFILREMAKWWLTIAKAIRFDIYELHKLYKSKINYIY